MDPTWNDQCPWTCCHGKSSCSGGGKDQLQALLHAHAAVGFSPYFENKDNGTHIMGMSWGLSEVTSGPQVIQFSCQANLPAKWQPNQSQPNELKELNKCAGLQICTRDPKGGEGGQQERTHEVINPRQGVGVVRQQNGSFPHFQSNFLPIRLILWWVAMCPNKKTVSQPTLQIRMAT